MSKRVTRGIRCEGEKVIGSGEPHYAFDKAIGHSGPAQPLPLKPQHHRIIGSSRMAHQEHPCGVAAEPLGIGLDPGDCRRTVFQHMGIPARWPEPVSRQHYQIAGPRKLAPDEVIVTRHARIPATAMDKHQHWVRPRRVRTNHFELLCRIGPKGYAAFQHGSPTGPGQRTVGPIKQRHRVGCHGIAPGPEQRRCNQRQYDQYPAHP